MENKQSKMFACRYENEPADLKLMLIYFIKRIRFVFYLTILGAILFASIYYLTTFVLVEEREYVATGELYLTYADDVRLDNVYINDYTWQNLIQTDKAIEFAMTRIESKVTEEYLKQIVTAGLVSDVRFVTLTVTTNDPALSVEIAQAFQEAIIELGKEMVDIEDVTVFTEADSATEIVSDNRTIRMALTGGVIGALVAVFAIVIQYVFDDSVYVASQFERRFGIPVIGICLKTKGNEVIDDNLIGQKKKVSESRLWGRQAVKLNYKILTQGLKKIAVADISFHGKPDFCHEILEDAKIKLEQDELLAIAMGKLKEEEAFYTSSEYKMIRVSSINEDAEKVLECTEAEGVVVLVQAGAHNGKLLERAIDLLYKQGCNVIGAMIYDGDPRLLKMYYYEPIFFRNKAANTEDTEEVNEDDSYKLDDLL